MRTDLVTGAILMVVAGVFYLQRDYEGRSSALFPDVVLVALVVLGLAIIAQALLGRGAADRLTLQVDLRRLAAAGLLLLIWAVLTGLIGFTISGLVAFVVVTLLVRGARPSPRILAIDLAVGVVVVVGSFLIFTKVLQVPLPVSTLIGM